MKGKEQNEYTTTLTDTWKMKKHEKGTTKRIENKICRHRIEEENTEKEKANTD